MTAGRPEPSGLDQRVAALCTAVGLPSPVARRPIRVWELSGVERLVLADGQTVVVKYAGPPFAAEHLTLRAAAAAGVPVPRVLAATVQDATLVMLLDDLGDATTAPSDTDAAIAAVHLHNAQPVALHLERWDTSRLAELPGTAIELLAALVADGRLQAAAGLRTPLDALARRASALTAGAETPPFGLVHGELHPTSLHLGSRGAHLLDLAKAFTGPGLLDLATWQGTRHPPDTARLDAQLHAYVAAGGTPLVHAPRGGVLAAVWALAWHRLWSAHWFLRQARDNPAAHDDRLVEQILHRQVTAAAELLAS